MYEVQIEKVLKAEEEKNKVMHEIADFLTKQVDELSNAGIAIYDEQDTTMALLGFTWDEEERMLKAIYDY